MNNFIYNTITTTVLEKGNLAMINGMQVYINAEFINNNISMFKEIYYVNIKLKSQSDFHYTIVDTTKNPSWYISNNSQISWEHVFASADYDIIPIFDIHTINLYNHTISKYKEGDIINQGPAYGGRGFNSLIIKNTDVKITSINDIMNVSIGEVGVYLSNINVWAPITNPLTLLDECEAELQNETGIYKILKSANPTAYWTIVLHMIADKLNANVENKDIKYSICNAGGYKYTNNFGQPIFYSVIHVKLAIKLMGDKMNYVLNHTGSDNRTITIKL